MHYLPRIINRRLNSTKVDAHPLSWSLTTTPGWTGLDVSASIPLDWTTRNRIASESPPFRKRYCITVLRVLTNASKRSMVSTPGDNTIDTPSSQAYSYVRCNTTFSLDRRRCHARISPTTVQARFTLCTFCTLDYTKIRKSWLWYLDLPAISN